MNFELPSVRFEGATCESARKIETLAKNKSRFEHYVPPRVARANYNKAGGIGASIGRKRLSELTTPKLRIPITKCWTDFRTFAAATQQHCARQTPPALSKVKQLTK